MLSAVVTASPVMAATLYPFGTLNGDLLAPRSDDETVLLTLPAEHPLEGYWGQSVVGLHTNGTLAQFTFPMPYATQAFPYTTGTNPDGWVVAPYWGDVDTRSAASGQINYRLETNAASLDTQRLVATWDRVGYFSNLTDKLNTFQLMMKALPSGQLQVEFVYPTGGLNWVNGAASNTLAQVGYDLNDGVNVFTMPGARSLAVLNLPMQSNLVPADPGRFQFFFPNRPPVAMVNTGFTVLTGAGKLIRPVELRYADTTLPLLIRYTVVTAPTAGQLVLNGLTLTAGSTFTQQDIKQNRLAYLHGGGAAVSDAFTFNVRDDQGLISATGTFNITISAAATGFPTISTITNTAINEDTPTPIPFTVSDAVTPAGSLVVTVASSNTALVASTGITLANNGTNRTVTLAPVANTSGASTITILVSDDDGNLTFRRFVLTVNPVNDGPLANADAYSVDEDSALTVTALMGVLANDLDADLDDLTAAIAATPSHGSVELMADGSFSYTPAAD